MSHYPNLTCKKHGEDQPCYVVCEHVASGMAAVRSVERPDRDPGLIVCEACDAIPKPIEDVSRFAPVCAFCAEERGWTKMRTADSD